MLFTSTSRTLATGAIAAVIAVAAVMPSASAQDLRSADARAAGLTTPAAHDLRSADARVTGAIPSIEQRAPAGGPSAPSGFDWVSAAIGAAGTGLLIVVLGGISTLGLAGRRRTLGVRS
jgi:hypothetical protein